MQREWWIGLSGWILQDGNYTDFAVGQVRQFALEFGYPRSSRMRVSNEGISCEPIDDDASYQVTADLIRVASEPMEDCFILDFGLRVYTHWMVLDDLQPPALGSRLAGRIWLGVDPFDYMDELVKRSGIPALIYTWRIDEIRLDTSPLIRIEPGHPLYLVPDGGPMTVRDPERRSWRSIDSTDMLNDEGSYTLRCALLDAEPVNSMEESGQSSPYGPIA